MYSCVSNFFLVGVIAGIHPDLLDVVRGDFCGIGRKVNVGHQWDAGVPGAHPRRARISPRARASFLLGAVMRTIWQPASIMRKRLGHRGFDVHGIGRRHGLQHDGRIASNVTPPM